MEDFQTQEQTLNLQNSDENLPQPGQFKAFGWILALLILTIFILVGITIFLKFEQGQLSQTLIFPTSTQIPESKFNLNP